MHRDIYIYIYMYFVTEMFLKTSIYYRYIHTFYHFLSELSPTVFCFDLVTHTCLFLGNTANERLWPFITQF